METKQTKKLGWAVVSNLLLYGPIIVKAIGPGTYYSSDCEQMSAITKASLLSFGMSLQNIFIMTLFFESLRNKHRLKWWLAIFIHLFASIWSQININCYFLVFGEIFIGLTLMVYCLFRLQSIDYRRKLRGY